jgi:peptidoglycan/LPS O-acetylase OafA/YrhL
MSFGTNAMSTSRSDSNENLVQQTVPSSMEARGTLNRLLRQQETPTKPVTGSSPLQSELPTHKAAYRPDIDGLRAIAVLAVVLFHCGVPGFNGGFTGVDIFFVISGFLITGLVKSGIDQKNFSFTEFYERRMRRLAPALALVLLSSFIVAFVYFTQLDFDLFSKSLFATSAFLSNVYFTRVTGGYFAVDSTFKPLLHTWSLAVEEQFYLLYPLFLVFIIRWAKSRLIQIVVVLLLASFAASCVGVVLAPEATFYLLPGRAWELLLGAIVSLAMISLPLDWRMREGLAWLGMACIVIAIGLLSSGSPFPGWNALLPCLGTALVIWANSEETSISRTLSHPSIVFFGLISYSLYLWHWPLITFYRYIINERLTASATVIIIAVSVGLASLSWKYVERPIRRRSNGLSRRNVFVLTGCATACLAALGLWGALSGGLPQRLSDQVVRYGSGRWDIDIKSRNCMETALSRAFEGNFCTVGGGDDSSPSFFVWGDSHASALMPAFDEMARQNDVLGWFASHAGCPSLLGIRLLQTPRPQKCEEFNEAIARAIVKQGIRDVVLVSRWSLYIYGYEEIPDSEKRWLPDPILAGVGGGSAVGDSIEAKKKIFEGGVKSTLEFLKTHGVRTWIVYEVPLQRVDVPNYLARNALLGNPAEGRLRSEVLARQEFIRGVFARIGSDLTYHIDPVTVLCPEGEPRCHLEADGRSLYSDYNHVSVYGAKVLEPLFIPMFDILYRYRENK